MLVLGLTSVWTGCSGQVRDDRNEDFAERNAVAAKQGLFTLGAEGDVSSRKPRYVQLAFGESWRGGTEQLKLLHKLPGFKDIHLKGSNIDDEALETIASVAQLQILTIENARITSRGLLALENADALLGLSLSDVDLSSEALAAIGHLNLSWLEIRMRDAFPVKAAIHFERWDNLVSLKLSGEGVSHAAVSAVGSLLELRHLDLSNTAIEDADLIHVESLPFLTDVDLSHTHVTGSGLSHLLSASHLRVLTLDDLSLEDSTWSTISRFEKLESLSLARTNVTDVTLATLAALQNLRSISLVGTDTSDAGLRPLLTLPHMITATDKHGDVIVVAEDWLTKRSPGKELLRTVKSEGKRLYRWRSGQREETVDSLPKFGQ
jgi:hypothetical protein